MFVISNMNAYLAAAKMENVCHKKIVCKSAKRTLIVKLAVVGKVIARKILFVKETNLIQINAKMILNASAIYVKIMFARPNMRIRIIANSTMNAYPDIVMKINVQIGLKLI